MTSSRVAKGVSVARPFTLLGLTVVGLVAGLALTWAGREDRAVYPILARAIGTDDATAALHRTHTEIFHLVRSLGRIVDELGPDGPTAEDRNDLQRALYGLDAILRLHMAQEEDLYASIDAEASSALVPRPA